MRLLQIDDAIHGVGIEIVDLSAAGPVAAIHLLPAVLVPAFRRQLEFRSSQQVGVGLPKTDWRASAAPAFDDGFEECVEAFAFVAGE